jgi:hypothetical protein
MGVSQVMNRMRGTPARAMSWPMSLWATLWPCAGLPLGCEKTSSVSCQFGQCCFLHKGPLGQGPRRR